MNIRLVAALLIVLAGFTTACRDPENPTADQTETISPLTPDQPASTTDAVTTQTVDIGDTERSPAEGEGATAEPTDTTGTTTR